jgi:HTH-type transcriptional regulator/antitoxin HigA
MSKAKTTAYIPDHVSPPGETLLETLEMHGLSQAELAERTGRPKKTINEIVQGKAAITPETAMQLELVLKVPASFWLAREQKYRAWLARQVENERLDKDTEFLAGLPLKEMAAYYWIEKSRDKREMTKTALTFFGVVHSNKIPLVQQAAFRKSEAYATNPWALAAWLRKGEIDAQNMNLQPYSRERFTSNLHAIRNLTVSKPEIFVPELVKLCADAGVTVVFTRELPKTFVSGATRWLSPDRPLIQFTLRHKCNDMFWFSFFHECGHVHNEDAKREILMEAKFDGLIDHREVAANKFAMDLLIPPLDLKEFIKTGIFTEESIKVFARRQGIHPGIVVGRLQFEKLLHFSKFHSLKESFSWNSWPILG